MSELEHLEQLAKSSGQRPEALDGPPLPPEAEGVWNIFMRLHHKRTYYGTGMGSAPNPLLPETILAWCNLHSVRLSCWEIEIIETLDAVWMRVMSEHRNV